MPSVLQNCWLWLCPPQIVGFVSGHDLAAGDRAVVDRLESKRAGFGRPCAGLTRCLCLLLWCGLALLGDSLISGHGLNGGNQAAAADAATATTPITATVAVAAIQTNGAPPVVRVGWQGLVPLGRWIPVTVDYPVAEAGRYRLEVRASDPVGDLVTFRGETVECQPGVQRLSCLARAGRVGEAVDVTVLLEDRVVFTQSLLPAAATSATTSAPEAPSAGQLLLLPQAVSLVVVLGVADDLSGFSEGAFASSTLRQVVRLASPTELPVDPLALDSVNQLLLTGPVDVPPQQSAMLEQWVRRGGRLTVCLESTRQTIRSGPLATWLPIQIGEQPTSVRELGALQLYAGKNVRIPILQRLTIAAISGSDARSLAPTRDPQVLLRAPLGFGFVTVLALDLTASPLKTWTGLPQLFDQLTASTADAADGAATSAGRNSSRPIGQLSSSGISDLASQLNAAQELVPGVSHFTPWPALALVLLFVLLVGPLDYFVVRHWLNRPALTWLTMPLIVVCGVTGILLTAGASSRTTTGMTRLELIDIDAATNTLRGHGWITAYSPETRRYDVRIAPEGWSDGRVDPSSIALGWFGIPEAAYGGMYRPAGLELQRGDYRWGPAPGRLSGVPVSQGSTKALTFEWSGTTTGCVDSELETSGIGRIRGSITHHLSAPLEDWFVAWSNRVFRQPRTENGTAVEPLLPETVWRFDLPAVEQRELRGFLTQTIVRRTQRPGRRSADVLTEQGKYNPLSRLVADLTPMVSFYTHAGGAGYTGLSNHGLQRLDLTELHDHGRAILFGRLRATPAGVEIGGAVTQADRHDVYVRIVLPVRKTTTELQELPLFFPK